MMKSRKRVAIGVMLLAVGSLSATAFAATAYQTPAEVVAGLTGRTTESVVAERMETGKTYGTMAKEVDQLEAFKVANLEIKKEMLAKQVAAGNLTQEEANNLLQSIETNQANCTGDGSAKLCQPTQQNKGACGMQPRNGCGSKGQGRGRCKVVF